MCLSSGKTDVEDNCISKDCDIDYGNESVSKCDSIACNNEDHVVRDVELWCKNNVGLVYRPSCRQ